MLRGSSSFHSSSFVMNCDNFKVLQCQISGQKGIKIVLKIAKTVIQRIWRDYSSLKMIFFIRFIETHHNYTLEIIQTDLWPFWCPVKTNMCLKRAKMMNFRSIFVQLLGPWACQTAYKAIITAANETFWYSTIVSMRKSS